MINFGSYINTCSEYNDIDELKRCWYWMGSKTADNDTPMYIRDSLYLINCPGAKFHHYFFYCNGNFMDKIDWSKITVYSQLKHTALENGITVECFKFINTQVADLTDIPTLVANVKPFTKYVEDSPDIIIDTDTYYQIMSCVGVPFIRESELEYNRQAILKLAIEPALKVYFANFPLEQPETVNLAGSYDIKLPPMALNGIVEPKGNIGAFQTNQSGIANIGLNASGAMAMSGGRFGGPRFTTGPYFKPVPGFSGLGEGESMIGAALDNLTLLNTLRQMSLKSRVDKVKEADGFHLKGMVNQGSILNITWLLWSRNWDDTDPMDFEELFALCQASVKRTLGPIYALLSDNTLPVNSKELKQEGNTEWKEITSAWKQSAWSKVYTTSKGGFLF